ncbi:hypothetical protein SAMN04488564_103423 [Lentzea waywayandensis]|uniref:Uncharacterized protein n=1 Tax=Lentzea waywayandensis TaxID=84724 RepID=A0A1I6DZ46_9PSEU|nr:hypothetical protein [Lentzea waywayandensis]SFR10558.1 hypothetical protein SAMN04488564_103423 [Lentzea waywayandensis]
MLSPEDVDLVANVRRIGELMPGVSFDIVMETLTPEREHEFGQILVTLGEMMTHRAERRGLPEQPIVFDRRDGLAKRIESITSAPHVTVIDMPGQK